jgi:hypothetical protein
MKTSCSKTKDIPGRLSDTTNKGARSWPLLPGILLADFGILLIGLAGCDVFRFETQSLLYSGAGILCLSGLVLISTGTMKLVGPTPAAAVRSKGNQMAQAALDWTINSPDFDWRSRPIHVALRH